MASSKKYWKNVEDLTQEGDRFKYNEFLSEIPVDEFLSDKQNLQKSSTSRRDFLKYIGFSTAAASIVACEGPVHKAIPYVVQPKDIIPGVAEYYATTMADGFDFASILIKTREGRPILVENNKEAKVHASANARVMASVLSMYDSLRAKKSSKQGKEISWEQVDKDIVQALKQAQESGKVIAIVTPTMASPSTYKLIEDFKKKYPTTTHVEYDAVSCDATLNAFESRYGVRAMADYHLDRASVIVSFGADFLGDWQGGGYESGYTKGRIPQNGKMSRHIQFEANMSLTGANADKRVPLKVAEQKVALAKFYGYLFGEAVSATLPEHIDKAVQQAAAQVAKAGDKAVVLCGIQDEDAQALVLYINEKIQSKAFDAQQPKFIRKGNAKHLEALVQDMEQGKVGVLLMSNVNPLYSLSNAERFENALKNVGVSVSFSMKEDETALKTDYLLAAPHYLESWGDVRMKYGAYALMQPTIRPLFETRQFQDSLLKWMDAEVSYYNYLKDYWNTSVLKGGTWNQSLHDGFYSKDEYLTIPASSFDEKQALRALSNSKSDGFELVLYTKTGMGDGQQANNPWLQEFPDPITRATWDNYLTISAFDAKSLGIENWNVADGALNGHCAEIEVSGVKMIVPVLIQPGQARSTVGLAFGYGRKQGLKKEMQVGVNAYKLYNQFSDVQSVKIKKVDRVHEFACLQLHNTLMGRGDILKETTLEEYNTRPASEWNPVPKVSLNHKEVVAKNVSLWQSFDRETGHHFNLSIDLNACTGCGACVIACHAENNVPVVGKAEVRKSRDMHWLRIDRYYSSEDTFKEDAEVVENIKGLGKALSTFGELEHPAENPQVAFLPVMCQHCDNAPCETVCPVAATSHGLQGQNQMIYNRCVGTRYCANNCPYKVRRFNWFLYNNNNEFDFHMNDDLGRMVLNPDVTVRSRGVMEKCSLCIQNTQAVILKAKREGRKVKEGEFNDACACANACGSGAMVFGDINEKESEITSKIKSDRAYHLLEHLGVDPNVVYQVKVRNTSEV